MDGQRALPVVHGRHCIGGLTGRKNNNTNALESFEHWHHSAWRLLSRYAAKYSHLADQPLVPRVVRLRVLVELIRVGHVRVHARGARNINNVRADDVVVLCRTVHSSRRDHNAVAS